MIFVSCFPITKILFTKIKTKTRLPCDNLAHAYNIHDQQKNLRTYEPFYLFESAYDGLILKRSNPLPLPEGPLSMKVA